MTKEPTVYLIPAHLDEASLHVLPPYLLDGVRACQVFFVENERSARRFLKSIWKDMVIDDYEWFTIHKAEEEVLQAFRQRLEAGKTIGIISEAGCPGIADPGQLLTGAAHEMGAVVHPLVGPSSILLALMGSGLNGQQFRFNGYLPVDAQDRARALRDLESDSKTRHCTEIFMETPYRNNQMLSAIMQVCRPSTRLCIAANLTGPKEFIRTRTVGEWKGLAAAGNEAAPRKTPDREVLPDLHKQPVIFCLLA